MAKTREPSEIANTFKETDKELFDLVFISLGEASTCWSETPSGVFDSTRCADLGDKILEYIHAKYVKKQSAQI